MSKLLIIIYCTLLFSVVLVPSVILAGFATRELKRERKIVFFIFSAIAILLPCLLSAFRGDTVGTDVLVYAEPIYLTIKGVGTINKAILLLGSKYEVGYLTIAFISSHLFHSFNMMLFLTQLLIIIPVYSSAIILNDKVPAWSTMLCFYSFFYIATFNIMRQGIAVSFLLLAFVELYKRKYAKSIICIAIATLFHSSALLGAILIICVYLVKYISSKYIRGTIIIMIVVFVPLIMTHWVDIFNMLISHGIISEKYAHYVYFLQGGKQYFTVLTLNHYLELFARWIGLIIPLLLISRKDLRKDDFLYMIFVGSLLATLIYTSIFIFLHSSYGYRISFYLEILLIIWVSTLNIPIRRISVKKVPIKTVLLWLCAFTCFFGGYMLRGWHGTMPFFFEIYPF